MGRLEVRRLEKGEVALYLDGEQVHPGQDVELLLENRVWILGRFEWSRQAQDRPTFHLCCGGPWENQDAGDTMPLPPEVSFAIPRDAFLRWPEERRSRPG